MKFCIWIIQKEDIWHWCKEYGHRNEKRGELFKDVHSLVVSLPGGPLLMTSKFVPQYYPAVLSPRPHRHSLLFLITWMFCSQSHTRPPEQVLPTFADSDLEVTTSSFLIPRSLVRCLRVWTSDLEIKCYSHKILSSV